MSPKRTDFWSLIAAGLVGGVATFLLNLLVWKSATLGTEFVAAIAGAVVGGVIALLVQLIALSAAASERQQERLETQAALGRSLLYKMVSIHSNLFKLAGHIDEGYALAEQQVREPWQAILPILNVPDRVVFTPEEMSMVLAQRDDNLFNTLLSIDDIHNSTLAIFLGYAEQREKLGAQLPVGRMHGNVGTAVLTPEEHSLLRPRMVELNGILDSLKTRGRQDADEAFAALRALLDLLNSKLGLKLKVALAASGPATSTGGKSH
jgi:hypothetical protein